MTSIKTQPSEIPTTESGKKEPIPLSSKVVPNIIAPLAPAEKNQTPPLELLNYYWHTIDEKRFPTVALPCIYRQSNDGTKIKYLNVRIIERTILSQFESMNSEEIKKHGALLSVCCTPAEIKLLNEINTKDVNYGAEFNSKDSMVKLDDFLKFYEILSRTCPIKTDSLVYNPNFSIYQNMRPMTNLQQVIPISNIHPIQIQPIYISNVYQLGNISTPLPQQRAPQINCAKKIIKMISKSNSPEPTTIVKIKNVIGQNSNNGKTIGQLEGEHSKNRTSQININKSTNNINIEQDDLIQEG